MGPNAGVAQLAERLLRKQRGGGSIPLTSSRRMTRTECPRCRGLLITDWFKEGDHTIAGRRCVNCGYRDAPPWQASVVYHHCYLPYGRSAGCACVKVLRGRFGRVLWRLVPDPNSYPACALHTPEDCNGRPALYE